MEVRLVPVGNSRGVRIPKPVIDQCEFGDTVELKVEQDRIVIAPRRAPRQGWDEAFRHAGSAGSENK